MTKNPHVKRLELNQIIKLVLRASVCRGPEANLAAKVIAQAINDSLKMAEARRSLMPGGGCELWAEALGLRAEYPREIAETLGYIQRERISA